ncbi:MAP3K epsilon protein kinase 1-like isoform X2 [Silene latifolia]|uniref:MAP3K epsilon protein kinase 1-like isoform X2 n=1 Tax=Silene latifolia TaxID=37657 RepID=UPI003D770492
MSRQITTPHFHKSKTLDNKYMLGDEIGKGAYGRVYKGLDLENGDFVAIKQVSLENIAQEDLNIIMQEIDLLKNLNHKNIVKYLGSLKTRSHLHIILEYVENGSLANIIKPNKFGPFPEQLVAHYIAQVLEGLVYLHEQGVIHRDIKGANILTTKEGLVKLADFGVATKLTEADVNTHSVVGTPYWMAPEVIEMSGVCAASDIWSVGCTVIELLTCVPPYYDLQPMPALFRIVQDENPPIPDGLSADMSDFLRLCFKKDARQRPDAKMLLSHPWIHNYRRTLHPPLPSSDADRNTQEDAVMVAQISNGHEIGMVENHALDGAALRETFPSNDGDNKFDDVDRQPSSNLSEEIAEMSGNVPPDQVPTLSIHDKVSIESTSAVSSQTDGVLALSEQFSESGHKMDHDEVLVNGEAGSTKPKEKDVSGKIEGKSSAVHKVNSLFSFGARSHDENIQKVAKKGISAVNELSRFSDPPADASLDDLFHPLNKNTEGRVPEMSASTSNSNVKPNTLAPESGKNDLATKLRAAIAQKQMENVMGQPDGGNLLRVMIRSLEEDVIDIDSGVVFDDKLPGENLFPLQAVEFSRLVGSLRPEEPEDVIVNSCQKLIAFFHQRPEQKIVFVTQYGLLPLMELLEVPRPRVICSVLRMINQIIKDNTDFQENACLVGLIPVVMSFAVPDRPREVRMEAAYFLQQLCQSSSLTLQMFIACRGIPVLVGFLEADYAKYRDMVHLAIDGMWQVFKLQRSTPRNDFCRIAAKNGILLRLTNTLYSLNEATRLASVTAGGGVLADGSVQQPRSGQLDPSHPVFSPSEALHLGSDQVDFRGRLSWADQSSITDKPQSSHTSNTTAESAATSRSTDPTDKFVNVVKEAARAEIDKRIADSTRRISTDRPRKSAEGASNVLPGVVSPQQAQVRPLLSLLEMEPPSRHFSGQLDVRNFTGIERHESVVPLLHTSNDKKVNGEFDFLMAEFAEVSGRGKENGNSETPRLSQKTAIKKLGSLPANDGATSTSGVASQTPSGVLSGSGVLNARAGSAASSGLLSHMVSSLNADVSREYLEKVAELLLEFALADTTVKSYMCSQSLLTRLFHMFHRVEPPILLKLLKCINHLSTDPNCLENLQRAEAIKHLIPNLELKEGPLISQIHHEVLNSLFNLCKINKRRQEQAAENGIIPHLMNFIMVDSPLKQYALPLLCDMAHASRNSREQLRAHGGLDVYLSLLDDELWSVTALDSIAVCLAHDNDSRKVEQALLKKDAVQKLVKFFENCPDQYFVHILEPFLKIITKSPRINTTLAVNGLTPLLIAKLDHRDAIARLNLLKLIKAVYEHHPRPKQLIVENDLPQKLQNLIEERRDGQRSAASGGGGQVLVKQMATSLLKALHINTVL